MIEHKVLTRLELPLKEYKHSHNQSVRRHVSNITFYFVILMHFSYHAKHKHILENQDYIVSLIYGIISIVFNETAH